jgi:DNA-binding XRE family transcriptional regulator
MYRKHINHSKSKEGDIFFIKKGCVRFMKNGLYEYCEGRRIKLGLSKSEFCSFLGISKPTYWRLHETGQASPHLLERISSRFLISREKLLRKAARCVEE